MRIRAPPSRCATAARILAAAYRDRREIPTTTSLDGAFDVAAAYAVERELVRMRREGGRATIGREDRLPAEGAARRRRSPLWNGSRSGSRSSTRCTPAGISAGGLRRGLRPARGARRASRRAVDASSIATLVERLPSFTVRLSKNGEVVGEGSGKNSLRSPAVAVAELAAAIARQPGADPLAASELISS